jgi:hypothetical protein
MPTPKDIPEPWRSFLRELDAAVGQPTRLECLGGFVVTQLYGFSRTTADIDALSIAPKASAEIIRRLGTLGGPLYAKHRVYFDFVSIAHVPESYEDRLIEMFPGAFSLLRLFALDPYDLALSKLERNIQRDRDDVRYLARSVPFDLEMLRERYRQELRWQVAVPEREDLTLQLWIEVIEEERKSRK